MIKFKPKDIEGCFYTALNGHRGTLVINKILALRLHADRQRLERILYGFVKPIIQHNVSIYALYDKTNEEFIGFATDAKGYHLSDYFEDVKLNYICTGNLEYSSFMSKKEARRMCADVARQFETVNVASMPSLYGYPYGEIDNILTYLHSGGTLGGIADFDKYFRRIL